LRRRPFDDKTIFSEKGMPNNNPPAFSLRGEPNQVVIAERMRCWIEQESTLVIDRESEKGITKAGNSAFLDRESPIGNTFDG
jgi:hypothetical protein